MSAIIIVDTHQAPCPPQEPAPTYLSTFGFHFVFLGLTHSLTAAQPAVGRSALHVDRSSATAHASSAESPESRTIWLIHVVRGLPAGRFQPWCGVSPDLVFTASFRVCAGVRSGRRRMWPKMEWRRAAMVLRILGTSLFYHVPTHLMENEDCSGSMEPLHWVTPYKNQNDEAKRTMRRHSRQR